MKKNFFPLSVLFSLFCLCSCNNSNTGTTKQNEANPALEVKSIFINGDSIHYIDVGKGDPVIFVHGTLGDYRTWRAQMDTFAKNHRVIAYSQRQLKPVGFYGSAPSLYISETASLSRAVQKGPQSIGYLTASFASRVKSPKLLLLQITSKRLHNLRSRRPIIGYYIE